MNLKEIESHIVELKNNLNMYTNCLDDPNEKSVVKKRESRDTREYLLNKYCNYIHSNNELKSLLDSVLTSNPYINGIIDDGIFTEKYFLRNFPQIIAELEKIKIGFIVLNDKSENDFENNIPVDIEVDQTPNIYKKFIIIYIDNICIKGKKVEDILKKIELTEIPLDSIIKISKSA